MPGSRATRAGLLAAMALAVALLGAAGPAPARAAEVPDVVLVSADCAQVPFICPAFVRAVRATGASARVVSPDPIREDKAGTLSLIADRGHELVIVSQNWFEALGPVAARYPDVRFALFDAPLAIVPGRPRNAVGIVIEPRDAAYLAGFLAARMEQRRPGPDVIGAVGGIKIPPVDTFIVGFRAGARRASPGVRVLVDYSDDFLDDAKCEALARRQIARGAGTVFNVAGACGLGTLRAARRAGAWGIGVDTDQSALGPHILTSVIKDYEGAFALLLRRARAGTLPLGRTTVIGLRRGGARLGKISPRVPASLRAELARVRAELLRGGGRAAS